MRWFTADLHIHTCLSPCGDLLMSPRKIIAEVLRQQIDIIAITDHNSAENVEAVMNAAKGTGITVLPGMEVCTMEEAHVLAIFDAMPTAIELQETVYFHLHGENDADLFGEQIIANEIDEVDGFLQKMLIGATELPIERIVADVHRLGGLAIASHVDRESFSVIGQLGFIPETLRFDALEVSSNTNDDEAKARLAEYRRFPFVRNSDAHYLSQIGLQRTRFWMEEASVNEMAMALRAQKGRLISS